MKKIIVGMSGGVDSSVAAFLLKREYEVIGVTLQMQGDCFDLSAVEDARKVADRLGIRHEVIKCGKTFTEEVKNYFADAYMKGLTPNPCIVCNRAVKWASLLDLADKEGADFVATGHYADIVRLGERYTLKDSGSGKDQTYALYMLSQDQLARTVMPLSGMPKEKVRELAKEIGLEVAEKPDSMDICFVPDHDYAKYLEEYTGKILPEGNFVDTEGRVLGRHRGITHYTVGQRKGLGIAFGVPMFVKEIKAETNEVILCPDDMLYETEVIIQDINYMGASDADDIKGIARIRYSHKGAKCSIIPNGDFLKICFETPVRAATPGQSAVVYDFEGRVLLGGTICGSMIK